ncbi:hypothetical protein GEMRC1_004379 [Eukaryota sp. GEM-RC1]
MHLPQSYSQLMHVCDQHPRHRLDRRIPLLPWLRESRFIFPVNSLSLRTPSVNRNSSLTLSTFFSLNRLERFNLQVANYDGPIAAAVMVRNFIDACFAVHHFNDPFYSSVTIDLIFGYNDVLPINALRNHVLSLVNTSHYIWLDVDFIPSPDLAFVSLPSPGEVYIVPAFEQANTTLVCPKTKPELIKLWDLDMMFPFDPELPVAHSLTKFSVWRQSSSIYPTRFNDYRNEPYFITHLLTTPPFDERFPYGYRNKMQHSAHLSVLNFNVFVIPDHFLVHIYHPPTNLSRMQILWDYGLTWAKLHSFFEFWLQQASNNVLFNYFDEYLIKRSEINMHC